MDTWGNQEGLNPHGNLPSDGWGNLPANGHGNLPSDVLGNPAPSDPGGIDGLFDTAVDILTSIFGG